MELKQVDFLAIQHHFVDFQKKSHCFEMPTENAYVLGIVEGGALIGYFIVAEYEDGTLEIQQGYLKPVAQHRKLSYEAMNILHAQAKKAGFTKVILKASRSLNAYTRFMRNLGYKPESIIFSRSI